MKTRRWTFIALALPILLLVGATASPRGQADRSSEEGQDFDQVIRKNARQMIREGRHIFRFDTFGDEAFWGDTIELHKAIEGAKFGGVGPGVTPRTALAVGLKVDADALPEKLQRQLRKGKVNLDDPATTLALLNLNAVIGVTGFFNPDGSLRSMGIQCALCHSIVDNSFSAPGIPPGNIGRRLDGWPNRDLNVGAIVALAPNLQPVADLLSSAGVPINVATVRTVLNSWGPGKFDAELFMDGKAFRPDGKSAATLIPPAFGLAGVNLHTWTGWGSVTHWNAFVANLEMHGVGTFFDPRLDDTSANPSAPTQFPIAFANRFGHVKPPLGEADQITGKLAALHFYQLAIPAPTPPEASFDPVAATRGEEIFNRKAKCATCHVPPLFTEPGWNMHAPEEIGIDSFQSDRAPDKRYRTSPLKGLWTHQKGGFFHDGRFATLLDVVNHYNDTGVGNNSVPLGLTTAEKRGVAFRTNEMVTEIRGKGRPSSVLTRSGKELPCDFVCIAVGIVPNVELAQQAGLRVNNGIVVNEYLQTSHPDIYGAGDVANYLDPVIGKQRRVEHWGHAEYCGQLAGQNMAGASSTYDLLTYVWSDIFDLHLEFAGDESEHDQVLLRGRFQDKSFTVLYLKQHVLTAYFAINTGSKEFPVLQRLIRLKKNLAGKDAQLQDPTFAVRGLL